MSNANIYHQSFIGLLSMVEDLLWAATVASSRALRPIDIVSRG